MPNVIVKNPDGDSVTYEGVKQVVLTEESGGTSGFYSVDNLVLDSPTVDLDFSGGDAQVLTPEENHLFRNVTIPRPEALLPENLLEGVTIAGVTGEATVQAEPLEIVATATNGSLSVASSDELDAVTVIYQIKDVYDTEVNRMAERAFTTDQDTLAVSYSASSGWKANAKFNQDEFFGAWAAAYFDAYVSGRSVGGMTSDLVRCRYMQWGLISELYILYAVLSYGEAYDNFLPFLPIIYDVPVLMADIELTESGGETEVLLSGYSVDESLSLGTFHMTLTEAQMNQILENAWKLHYVSIDWAAMSVEFCDELPEGISYPASDEIELVDLWRVLLRSQGVDISCTLKEGTDYTYDPETGVINFSKTDPGWIIVGASGMTDRLDPIIGLIF